MFNVTQRSLVKTRLQFNDALLPCGSLFPLFTSGGKVGKLLLLDHVNGEILTSPWVKGMLWKPWFGPLRIRRPLTSWQPVSKEMARRNSHLWHFDPWWMMIEKPFLEHPAGEILRATNAAIERSDVKGIYFSRDLARLTVLQPEGGELQSYQDGFFPPRKPVPEPEVKPVATASWVLRPFWEPRRTA